MNCVLTGDQATRYECFSGFNAALLLAFDTKNPRAPTRVWKKHPPSRDYKKFKDGFYVSENHVFRPWCEECYRLVQFDSPHPLPQKIREVVPEEDSFESVRKIVRKKFGFSVTKKISLIDELSKRYPGFSEQGLFSAAFIVIAIAKVKGVITNSDLTVKKSSKGLFIQEFSENIVKKLEEGEVFDSVPNFSEKEMIDFVRTKTDWSLKHDEESYSLEELANQYYLGLGEAF
jgi:hypothetical protein